MLNLDTDALRAAAMPDAEVKEFTLQIATQLFEQFRQGLVEAGKNVINAQFSMMRLEVYLPDEMCIISPSELTDTYCA